MHIRTKRGLTIPIKTFFRKNVVSLAPSPFVALDLSPFFYLKIKNLLQENDYVQTGQPLAQDKNCQERVFVSPASGKVVKIERGEKRRIEKIIIQNDGLNTSYSFSQSSKKSIMEKLSMYGLFPYIRRRPFDLIADATLPRTIFIMAVHSAPGAVEPSILIEGEEEFFHKGIAILASLCEKNTHIVYRKKEICKAVLQAKNVLHHTVEGPHPIESASIAIAAIDPVRSEKDLIWTIGILGVISIGKMFLEEKFYQKRVVSIFGEKVNNPGLYATQAGFAFSQIFGEKNVDRIISGSPLSGNESAFLGFYDTTVCSFPNETKREAFSFLRLGWNKYSFSSVFLSCLRRKKEFSFTTNLEGEERAFIMPTIYQKVMPLKVPVALCIKALLAQDF